MRIQFRSFDSDIYAGKIIFNSAEGFYGIPTRVSEADLPTEDGSNIWAVRYSGRPIVLQGNIITTSAAVFFATIDALMLGFSKTGSDYVLTFTKWDGSIRYLDAQVIEEPQIIHEGGQATVAKFQISLKASNPFFRGTFTTNTLTLTNVGGIPLPFKLPAPLLLGNSNSQITINNTGDASYYPTVVFNGQCTNPSIVNITTGEQFRYTGSIPYGSNVTVTRTTRGKTILLNGITNVIDSTEGYPITIVPGNNVIKFNAATFDSSASCVITTASYYKHL